jgi:hypothetical protein
MKWGHRTRIDQRTLTLFPGSRSSAGVGWASVVRYTLASRQFPALWPHQLRLSASDHLERVRLDPCDDGIRDGRGRLAREAELGAGAAFTPA